MILAEVHTFIPWSHLGYPLEGLGYSFWSGIGSDFGELTLIASVLGSFLVAYKHIECHQEGCHRLGRFPHGHLKLCHVHHPHVPSDGKINQTHIDAMTKAKKIEAGVLKPVKRSGKAVE